MIISSNDDTVKNLTGVEGGSVTFPELVSQQGLLIFEGIVIAMVTDSKNEILEDSWKTKVFWNNTTRLFSVRKLHTNNSGLFTITVVGGATAYYELTVFGK